MVILLVTVYYITSLHLLKMGNCQCASTSKEKRSESHAGPDNATLLTEYSLNNGLIFDLIFDYIPKRDWKSVRRVNKTCHSYIQPRWREQMVYNLGHGKRCPEAHTVTAIFLEKKHPAKNRKDPLQLNHFPIRNIFITSWGCIDKSTDLLQKNQTGFWELYGSKLKRLHLDGVRIHTVAPLKKLLFELTPNLEEFRFSNCFHEDIDKLELNIRTEYTPPATPQKKLIFVDLSIEDYNDDENHSDDYRARFPINWIEFFSQFSNIQKLKLEIDPLITQRPSDLLKLFEAIDIIRKANDNQVLNITELRMHLYGVGFDHVDVIKNQSIFASLPISILHIPTYFRSGNDRKIALVRTFKSTLRDLILLGPGPGKHFPNDMLGQGLTKLGLIGPDLCFSSFEFLAHTPNLEELEFQEDITPMLQPEVCADLDKIAPVVNLKKLRFQLRGGTSPAATEVEMLGRLIPNVKKCICKVGPDGFQMVCQIWPNLEYLDLNVYFPSEDFFVEHLVRLKCLKTLRVRLYYGKISDKSVFEGFLMLPSLTRLELGSNEMHYLSEEGRKALEGKLCDNTFDGWIDMFQRTE